MTVYICSNRLTSKDCGSEDLNGRRGRAKRWCPFYVHLILFVLLKAHWSHNDHPRDSRVDFRGQCILFYHTRTSIPFKGQNNNGLFLEIEAMTILLQLTWCKYVGDCQSWAHFPILRFLLCSWRSYLLGEEDLSHMNNSVLPPIRMD